MDRRVARSEIARPSPGRSRMVIRSLAGPVSDTVRIGNRSAHSRSHRTPRSARADSDTPCLFASSMNSAFSSSGTRIVMVGPVAGAEASLMRSPEICVLERGQDSRVAAFVTRSLCKIDPHVEGELPFRISRRVPTARSNWCPAQARGRFKASHCNGRRPMDLGR